jgi:hypothetical protein
MLLLSPVAPIERPGAMINAGLVNGAGFKYAPAAKAAPFRDFTRKNAILKTR